jgi:intracellular multiplication protein IcmE
VEANSDVPGPVLAQVASGPLKGARLIGQFSVESDKYLAITFSTAVVDGQAISINAIALDPGTTLPGMATDIDNRYLTRVILPAAAAFVEGWTQAVADSGATTVTVSGDTVIDESNPTTNTQEVNAGIAEAGAEIGDILSDIADDTEVMVKVAAGTPMGVLFLSPVVESEATLITPEMQMEERRRLEEREAFGAALGDRFGQTERRVDGRMDDRRMDDLDRRLEDAQDRGYRYMVY